MSLHFSSFFSDLVAFLSFADLLKEYCEWIPEALRGDVTAIWPPLDE